MIKKTNWLSWRVWMFSAGFWTAFGVTALGTSPGTSEFGSLRQALTVLLLYFGPLVVATPLLLEASSRLIRRDCSGARFWARFAMLVVGSALLHEALVLCWQGMPPRLLLVNGLFALLTRHATIGCFAVAVNHHENARTRQRELLDAQLRALRSQLQPHFLFNTLHAISVTGRTDSGAATRMLTLLGDLLRLTLRERNGEFVTLAEEQELLQPYLELQKVRFPDRLRIEIDFPEDVLGCAVPDLLLQPLVENALKHGLEQRPEGGTVRIAARRWGDRLEIQVRDDGAGLAGAGGVQLGVGLGTTKARLAALFGDAATVTLAPSPGGGAVATVTLPWREVARAA